MKKNMLQKGLIIALSTSLSMMLLSGCSNKSTPSVKQEVVTVEMSPAELYLSSDEIDTRAEEPKQENLYDLEVKIDNTENAAAYVNLENRGQVALNVSKIQFKNNSENLFDLESACGNKVMPDSSCKLKISFHGKYAGRYTSDIIISSDSNGEYVGQVGKIHIIANGSDRLRGVINPLQTTSAKAKQKPMTKLFFTKNDLVKYAELKNNGLEDITIKGFHIIGADKNYFTYSQECPKTLKVGQSCELKITYKKKWDSLALSYLVVDSNGVLFPSDTIRLKGTPSVAKKAPKILQLADNDDMNIQITDVNTTVNHENFLEDFSDIKPIYYFRTMYQNNVDVKFKEYYEEIVNYYFTKNGFKVTRNPKKADKILNIYPTIKVLENGKGDIQIKSNIKANVVTKSNAKDAAEKIEFNMTIVANNYSDSYFAYVTASNMLNSFMFNLLGLEE